MTSILFSILFVDLPAQTSAAMSGTFTPGLEGFPYDLDASCSVEDWLHLCHVCDDIEARFSAREEAIEGN